ncbi:hypothetical protein E4L95_20445 [Paracoccus liaowanqingii]|uniref:Peptidylprolyl isomerase n=1 Tax=Paracoccus liaowanqingii TaxID=2560053 RepID=A0A4Z1CD99_9RHOB|nr:hypothetical protein [Paracoccus liaowanqingii]TGN43640.1 hypothetical protein E4L95_20445 [Paracoccus liaowanqingii]
MTTASRLSSTAVAAALFLPLAFGPVWAQDAQTGGQPDSGTAVQGQGTGHSPSTGQTQDSGQNQHSGQQQGQQQPGDSADDMSGGAQADTLVATVGGTEIRGSDLMTVIGALPPQLQSQSPQMLVPIALEQLIMRELIVEKARSENLAEDPEVTELVSGAMQVAEEDALVQVWLERELAKSVTDEAVQQSYDDAQAQGQQDLPPLEDLRPQIEQHLRSQAVEDLRIQLREGADIVLYDATGRPLVETDQGTQTSDASNQAGGGNTSSGTSGSNNGASSDSSGSSSGSGSGTDEATSSNASSSDAAKSQAEQAGMQDVEAMLGTTILKGKSATNADVYMIVGPSGELLAVAGPLPGQSGGSSQSASDGQGSAATAPEAGEPAQGGFMATQAQPATPNMWDPAAVEQAMRQLELGQRGAVGEVDNP